MTWSDISNGQEIKTSAGPGQGCLCHRNIYQGKFVCWSWLKSRKSISWKSTITGCTAIPWIFWPGSKCKGLIWKNVAHVVIIKHTHGLGDREINNLCFRKNYLLCVGNRWHLFQWFVWGILSDYRQSRVGGLGGLGQTNRASYMPTEMDSPQNEILERDVVSWFHKSWESILKVCTFLNTFQW